MAYPLRADGMLSTSPRLALATQYASQVFFFALFPVYFAYHAVTGANLVPAFLPGGGWSVYTFPGALILGVLVALSAPNNWAWRLHAIVVGLLASWVTAYGVGHFLFGVEWQRNPELLKETIKLVAGWVCLYGIGYLLPLKPLFVRVCLCALVAMAVCVFFLKPEQLQDGPATYQGYATSVVFVAMLCLASVRAEMQPFVLALGFAALLALSARADLGGFGLVALAWITVSLAERKFRLVAIGIGASLIALVISAMLVGLLPNPVPRLVPTLAWTPQTSSSPVTTTAFRNQELLDVRRSQSYVARAELVRKGLADIAASPIAGIYGGQTRDGGSHGAYVHNALSAWSQFGLVPFVLYVGLCLATVAGALFQPELRSPKRKLMLFVGIFTTALALLSESVFWAMPALAWGLLADRLMIRSKQQSSGMGSRNSSGPLGDCRAPLQRAALAGSARA